MANPVEISQELNIAPDLGIEMTEQHTARRFSLRRAVGLTGFAISTGLGTGVIIEAFDQDAPKVYAEGCWVEEDGVKNWYDPCPGSAPAPPPAPSPSPSPNPNPSPSPNPKPNPAPAPKPTVPYSERDSDGDGIKNGVDNCDNVPNPDQSNMDGDVDGDACESDGDIDGDTFLQRVSDEPFYDVDDHSPGLGELGLQMLVDRGVDLTRDSANPDNPSLNELIGYTVHPHQWEQTISNFAAYGVEVLATTTTTTVASTPATTNAPASPATVAPSTPQSTEVSSTITTSSTTARATTTIAEEEAPESTEDDAVENTTSLPEVIEEVSPTTTEEVSIAVVSSEQESGGINWLIPAGFGIGGVAFGGLILLATRRRNTEDQKGFGGTSPRPIAGN